MTFRRPHIAKRDENHAEIMRDLSRMVGGWENLQKYSAFRGFVAGVPFLILDTSRADGLSLDTRLYIGSRVLDVEIKQPQSRDDLTDGERLYFEITPETGRIVTCAEEYYAVICEAIK